MANLPSPFKKTCALSGLPCHFFLLSRVPWPPFFTRLSNGVVRDLNAFLWQHVVLTWCKDIITLPIYSSLEFREGRRKRTSERTRRSAMKYNGHGKSAFNSTLFGTYAPKMLSFVDVRSLTNPQRWTGHSSSRKEKEMRELRWRCLEDYCFFLPCYDALRFL